jgi:hypothetical protein
MTNIYYKRYLDLGFNMDMIRIHPDSVSLNDEPVDVQKREELYGFKLLGAFIGSTKYIQQNSLKKTELLHIEKHNLTTLNRCLLVS